MSSDVDPDAARKSRERNSPHHGREPVFLQMRRKAESDAEQKSARLKQQRITREAAAVTAAAAELSDPAPDAVPPRRAAAKK